MAEVVRKRVEWNKSRNFPWDKWTDGRVWRVTKGVDFTSSVCRMRQRIYAAGQKYGKRCHTKVEDNKSILFQFYVEG